MYLKHKSDLNAVSRSMFLNEEQQEYIGRLSCGYGIVKLAGRIFNPFLLKFPLIPVKKGSITDEIVVRHMAKQGFSTQLGVKSAALQKGQEVYHSSISDKKEVEKWKVIGEALIRDILLNPFDALNKRISRLGHSNKKIKYVIDLLKKENKIKTREINTGKTRKILLEITDLIDNSGKSESVVHKYWNNKIMLMNSAFYDVVLNKKIEGNGIIDQIVTEPNTKSGFQVAIEIETGKSRPIHNIIKSLEAGFPLILSLATDLEAYNSIEKSLEKDNLHNDPRIKLVLIQKYSPELIPIFIQKLKGRKA